MSMNLILLAEVNAKLPSRKDYRIKKSFTLYQTPTEITNKILDSEDQQIAYEQWVLREPDNSKYPIFDPNFDMFYCREEDVIKDHPEKILGWGSGNYDHINNLRNWIYTHKDLGFEIRWFAI